MSIALYNYAIIKVSILVTDQEDDGQRTNFIL